MSRTHSQLPPARRTRVIGHGVGLGCLFFYLAWNALWLVHRQIPPSIALSVFGIPCPTTGVTRSLAALSHGDIWGSLCWNPLAVPLTFLFVSSVALAVRGLIRRRNLPRLVVLTWAVLLPLAWAIKLIQGPAWW